MTMNFTRAEATLLNVVWLIKDIQTYPGILNTLIELAIKDPEFVKEGETRAVSRLRNVELVIRRSRGLRVMIRERSATRATHVPLRALTINLEPFINQDYGHIFQAMFIKMYHFRYARAMIALDETLDKLAIPNPTLWDRVSQFLFGTGRATKVVTGNRAFDQLIKFNIHYGVALPSDGVRILTTLEPTWKTDRNNDVFPLATPSTETVEDVAHLKEIVIKSASF